MVELYIYPVHITGKQRPYVAKTHTFTRQETVDAEDEISKEYMCKYPGHRPFFKKIPLKINLEITFKKKKQITSYPITRPDIDNIFKLVADALNGLAYDDDSQIVTANIKKIFGKEDRYYIRIEEEKC